MDRLEIIRKIEQLESDPKEVMRALLAPMNAYEAPANYQHAFDYYLIGRAYLLTGKQESSLRPLNLALKYFEKIESVFGRFYCYSSLGIAYRELKETHLSINSFEKAYNLSYEMDDFSYLIKALMNLGSIYASSESQEKALEMLEKALEYEAYVAGTKTLGDLYNNYAFVLLGMGHSKSALTYLIKAKDVYTGYYGDIKHINSIIVEANIGETYLELEEYNKAESFLRSAVADAQAENIEFIIMDCKLNLSKVYEAQGKYKESLDSFKAYTEIRKAVESVESSDEIEELKDKLIEETTRSEREIDMLRNVELKNKTQELEKTLKNLSLIGEIGQKLTSSMDMDEIYTILRQSIYGLMLADIFGLALYDESNEKIIYKYFEHQGVDMPLMEVSVHDDNALAAFAINHKRDIYIEDFDEEYADYIKVIRPIGSEDRSNHAKCIMYCRLVSEGRVIGLITLQNYQPFAYSKSDFEVVKALASYVAIAISNAQKKNLISEKAKELEYLSYNDPLTDLFNRRFFNETMSELIHENCMPLGLIIGDMNNLKIINDTYGHMAGDQYLIEAAKIFQSIAEVDYIFRIGGDEFAILLPNTTVKKMQQIIEEIKQKASTINLVGETLSLALGCEVMTAIGTLDRQLLFSKAETKMYEDKKRMKN